MRSKSLQIIMIIGDLGILVIYCILFGLIKEAKTEEEQQTNLGLSIIGIILFIFIANIFFLLFGILHKLYLNKLKRKKKRKLIIRRPLYIRHIRSSNPKEITLS